MQSRQPDFLQRKASGELQRTSSGFPAGGKEAQPGDAQMRDQAGHGTANAATAQNGGPAAPNHARRHSDMLSALPATSVAPNVGAPRSAGVSMPGTLRAPGSSTVGAVPDALLKQGVAGPSTQAGHGTASAAPSKRTATSIVGTAALSHGAVTQPYKILASASAAAPSSFGAAAAPPARSSTQAGSRVLASKPDAAGPSTSSAPLGTSAAAAPIVDPGAAISRSTASQPPVQPQQRFTSASTNPMYGSQDTGLSPMIKREAYAPALSHTLLAASSRGQLQGRGPPTPGASGAAGSGGAVPALANTGDLFNPNAVQVAWSVRPTNTMYYMGQQQWEYGRPSLTGLDLIKAAVEESSKRDGFSVPPDPSHLSHSDLLHAEIEVVQDLIFCFQGLVTRHIRARATGGPSGAVGMSPASRPPQPQGPSLHYVAAKDLDVTLQERAGKLLHVCDYVAVIQRFVETRSSKVFGTVFQALAASLRGYLEDWRLVVGMMEHQYALGALDLARLTFYCQQPASGLQVLAEVAAAAAVPELSAAGLLNLLHRRHSECAGNASARTLLGHLLAAAAQPYCAILQQWMLSGRLNDPHLEFMVVQGEIPGVDSQVQADVALKGLRYWQRRFTLRRVAQAPPEAPQGSSSAPSTPAPRSAPSSAPVQEAPVDVPLFLAPLMGVILKSGTYLNIIRECKAASGDPMASPAPAMLRGGGGPQQQQQAAWFYDPAHPTAIGHSIKTAHAAASSELLALLMGRAPAGPGSAGASSAGLTAVLRSLKHFFLLDQGDVLTGIMEVAAEELSKPAKSISKTRLKSLLEMAVKLSSAAQDPHAEKLTYDMDPRPLDVLVKEALAACSCWDAAGAGGRAGGWAPQSVGNTPSGGGSGMPGSHAGMSGRTPGGSRLLGPRDEDMQGWDLLLLSFRMEWPATLVIGDEQLKCYQVVFKHLLTLKRTERLLCGAWQLMLSTRSKPMANAKRRQKQVAMAHAVCHRLIFGVQELQRYATLDVLEPLWCALEAMVLQRASDIDQVIEGHNEFLQRSLAGLLLVQPPVAQALANFQGVAVSFAKHVITLWEAILAGVVTSSKGTQTLSAAEIAAEQQANAVLEASLSDIQRHDAEAQAAFSELRATISALHDELLNLGTGRVTSAGAGGTGGPGLVRPGGARAGAGAMGLDSTAMEYMALGGGLLGAEHLLPALHNLVDRLSYNQPARGSRAAIIAELAAASGGR